MTEVRVRSGTVPTEENTIARLNVIALKLDAMSRIIQDHQSKLAFLQQRVLTLPSGLIEAHNPTPKKPIRNKNDRPIRNIKEAKELGAMLARRSGIDPARVFAPIKRVPPNVALIRKALTYRLRAWDWSYSELAKLFNLRDHTTVIHYARSAEEAVELFTTPISNME